MPWPIFCLGKFRLQAACQLRFPSLWINYLPMKFGEIKVGDYTLIHVGFALNLIDEEEALETLDLLKQIGDFEKEIVGDYDDDILSPPGAISSEEAG